MAILGLLRLNSGDRIVKRWVISGMRISAKRPLRQRLAFTELSPGPGFTWAHFESPAEPAEKIQVRGGPGQFSAVPAGLPTRLRTDAQRTRSLLRSYHVV